MLLVDLSHSQLLPVRCISSCITDLSVGQDADHYHYI